MDSFKACDLEEHYFDGEVRIEVLDLDMMLFALGGDTISWRQALEEACLRKDVKMTKEIMRYGDGIYYPSGINYYTPQCGWPLVKDIVTQSNWGELLGRACELKDYELVEQLQKWGEGNWSDALYRAAKSCDKKLFEMVLGHVSNPDWSVILTGACGVGWSDIVYLVIQNDPDVCCNYCGEWAIYH
jgi:hypothetical protein